MQRAVEINRRGLILRGTLHLPEQACERPPVVCLFHGFTSTRIEVNFLFVKLSRLLEKAGIACVRFDFGGSGDSDGDFFDMTVSGELEDAKAILQAVRSWDFIDRDRVGLLGASMGGLVAGLLAGNCREAVRALCLWAPACNMRDIYTARDIGAGDFGEMTAEQRKRMEADGCRDFNGLALSTNYLKDLESVDIIKRSAAFDKSVLILHGDRDRAVPIENSDKYLAAYGDRASLHVLKGCDHQFSSSGWQRELFGSTVEFFKTQL